MATLEAKIKDYAWPWPENWRPGIKYMYVPATQIKEAKEEMWEHTKEEHSFGGVEYLLMQKGAALRYVKQNQTVPEISVWMEPEVEVNATSPVKADTKPRNRRKPPEDVNEVSVPA